MRYRIAGRDDAGLLAGLCETISLQDRGMPGDFEIPIPSEINGDGGRFPEMLVIAEERCQVIGCVSAGEKDGVCRIGRLFVHPDYRTKGVGQRLIREVEKLCRKVSKYEMTLEYHDYDSIYFCCMLGYGIDTVKTGACKDGLIYMEKICHEDGTDRFYG